MRAASDPWSLDGTLTNWSLELEAEVWRQVAVYEDGSRTTMFIDSAPIVPSPRTESIGIARDGSSWLVGACSLDHRVDKAFAGWPGDVRVVERVLGPDERLSAH